MLSELSMLSKLKLPPGVYMLEGGGGQHAGLLNKIKGGGSNRLPGHGLATKHQAVEFPQVQTSSIQL